MQLRPDADITAAQLEAAKRSLVWDAAWASVTGTLSGGVLLVAFALAIGAEPLEIGVIAAIPFIAQALQLPGVGLVDRIRQRKKIGVLAVTLARVVLLATAVLPFMSQDSHRLGWLIGAQAVVAGLGALAACAINSWFHELLPAQTLGSFFARRFLVATLVASLGTLTAGLMVEQLRPYAPLSGYSVAFAVAGLAGFASSYCLARTPEPLMLDAGPRRSMLAQLRIPLADVNFRSLLLLLGGWNLASNMASPFLTVYLMRQLGLGLSTVTTLWVASQLANATTLFMWGRVSDRLSNKAILSVALPLYFACTFGLVFADAGGLQGLQLPLLYALHIAMGAAGGGIALACGNLGMKLAPRSEGTAYLAAVGLVSAVFGGAAPVLAGAIAQAVSQSQLSILVRWTSSTTSGEVSVLAFAHWEFLFALSALLGLYVMHTLSRIQEGDEVSERVVVQELALEAVRTVNHVSSLGGLIGNVFSFERTSERRRFGRRRAPRSP